MIINGQGYVCKSCKREVMSDDVTYYGASADTIKTICCYAKVVKPSWMDRLWDKLWKR